MNANTIPPGTETCGCCDGVTVSTPLAIDNRGGLSAIAYRIGDYARFKESLIASLSSSQYAALAKLLTRDDDDYTLGLLDAAACAADVLTFYQERLANESYLRTATERVSLQELARLIGYRLRPGVSAETWVAFALETPKTPPPGSSTDPGSFVTGIPTSLKLEPGIKMQSIPGPGEQAQTFETVEPLEARPQWNAIAPLMSETRYPGRGATFTWLAGTRNNLKPGDALLFVGPEFIAAPHANNNWDVRLVDTVTLDSAADRTRVSWKRGLGSLTPHSNPSQQPQVHVLRKRAAVFGNNAPMWKSMNRDFRADYPGGSDAGDQWPGFTITPGSVSNTSGHIDLDAVYGEITHGSFVVLTKGEFNRPDENYPRGTYVELYRVTGTTEVSRAQFALSGKVSRLGVAGQNLLDVFYNAVRETSAYVQSEQLAFTAHPLTEAIRGDVLPLTAPALELQPARPIIVTGKTRTGAEVNHFATIVEVAASAGGATLHIAPPLPSALQRDSVVVYANVALARHGDTVAQILGAGDASQSFQRFELKRTPLSYRAAATEIGAASELTVRVGDVAWTEEPTLFGAGATERAYTLNTDEQDKTWVTFGDGLRGSRLPSGTNNVRASYRIGIGSAGNLASHKLTQLITRPLGLKSVSNPLPASGGTDPEAADQARRSIPLGTRTLGRAVSLLDYEDFALAFSGVAKAQARMLPLVSGPTIAITIAGQEGASLASPNPVNANLLAALKNLGDPYVQVVLLPYQASTFKLGLKIKRDPAYEAQPLLAAVESALRIHYSFDARALAQPVLQSDVIALVHTVPGVVAVDLDFLYGGSAPHAQTLRSLQTRLLASQMRVSAGSALPAELLTLDLAPLERLEEMT